MFKKLTLKYKFLFVFPPFSSHFDAVTKKRKSEILNTSNASNSNYQVRIEKNYLSLTLIYTPQNAKGLMKKKSM